MPTTVDPPSDHPVGIVRRYPLTCFFALAYGLSWLAWSPLVLSANTELGVLPLEIPTVLGSTQVLGLMPGAYLGPITAALIITATVEGRSGLRRWARRLSRWRVGWRWYGVVLLGPPAVVIASTFVLPGAWHHPRLPALGTLLGYVPLLLMQLLTTGLAEEPGWRDFALPRLQHRFGPLFGTVVLGVLWGGWHLPLFLTTWAGWPDVRWYDPVQFIATCVVLSITMTWIFNRTGESVPMVMLLHASINNVFSELWPAMFPELDPYRDSLYVFLIASVLTTAVLVGATRGRLGNPAAADDRFSPDHHAP
ncbi:CPBP family intramembrane metalloprotease [Saccharopolyspora indica]|uniref:CPBP family intramembrane glutamic endopeptidase n=1 Tax=Saccharopolyspora indica TaxID=1229659 RepID=UPI0022EAD2D0|nr:type II CAAX endopeptidase family protein [Saccharopolyspora indica]MDA3647116.1 type II CAAX endopeptidase family protein [Saccharopolyspora indica]